MRVLLQNRGDLLTNRRGDTVQVERIAAELQKLGVDAEINVEAAADLAGVDLVHIFNCWWSDNLAQAANARQQQVPYVVSPIFVDLDPFNFEMTTNPRVRLIRRVLGARTSFALHRRWMQRRLHVDHHWQEVREVLVGAAQLMPSSRYEENVVRRRFGVRTPSHPVALAVDATYAGGDADRFEKKFGLRNFVLCAGRIEPHKNQLNLIRALEGSQFQLVCAGRTEKVREGYRQECAALAKQLGVELTILDHLDETELADAYAAAAVHALPSWSETTGLVNLEAAAAGCAVATTIYSPAEELLRGEVALCRPEDPKSIRRSVDQAARMPAEQRAELARFVVETHTWERVGRETLAGYQTAVSPQNA